MMIFTRKIAFFAGIFIFFTSNVIISQPQKENLGKHINTIYDERAPVISPDGKLLYFTRGGDPRNLGYSRWNEEQDIWVSYRSGDGSWTEAMNMGRPLNNEYPNSINSVSPDGNTLLLLGAYNRNGNVTPGFSISHKIAGGWSYPQPLQIREFYNDDRHAIACMSDDGNALLLALARDNSIGKKDIFVSFKVDDSSWTAPLNLGEQINSEYEEYSPFLASDGVTLYFSSQKPGGLGGYDVYVSKRLDSSWTKWSKPQSLGNNINTKEDDLFFKIPSSGDYLYYLSYHDSYGKGDIFRIPLPKTLKPEPVMLLSGRVTEEFSGAALFAKIYYEELPNYNKIGEARTDPITGEYKITLPAGRKYRFYASSADHIAYGDTIDASGLNSYTERAHNIELSRIDIGIITTLNPIDFGEGNELDNEALRECDFAVQFLNQHPGKVLILKAYTDEKHKEKTEKRAEIIYDLILRQYIPKNRIKKEIIVDEKLSEPDRILLIPSN